MENKIPALIAIVVLVVVGAVLFPMVNSQVADLTNSSSANYVGADTESIVSLIPIFYWLMIALVCIGAAVVVLKDAT